MSPTTADVAAEIIVAGCCAASANGARLAHQRLTADDFTRPALAAIFAAAISLPDHPNPTVEQAEAWAAAYLAGQQPATIWPSELRLQALAEQVGVTADDLTALFADRPVLEDTTGRYANRVRAAARARQIKRHVIELHQLLDDPGAGDHQRAATLATRIAEQLEPVQ